MSYRKILGADDVYYLPSLDPMEDTYSFNGYGYISSFIIWSNNTSSNHPRLQGEIVSGYENIFWKIF